MSAIALFGALTLGVPHLQDTAAVSLAEKKSPSPSGVKLAAPFCWVRRFLFSFMRSNVASVHDTRTNMSSMLICVHRP